MRADLSTYLVTDPELCGERGELQTVREAVAGGVTTVQIRDKHASARALSALTRAVLDAVRGRGVTVVVNDRLDVAMAAGAHGVHLGQDDLPVEDARRIAGNDLLVGLSISSAEEMDAALALPDGMVDYLGIGPVFATPTKSDAAPPVGAAGLADLCRRTELPCVAIGGIDADNAAEVRGTGVQGIAVVSAICSAPDPAHAAAVLTGRAR